MHIKAISVSDKKGMRKKNIVSARLKKNYGIDGDAHAGNWHRQISFLAQESILSMRDKGLDVVAGNFAENLTTEGIDLTALKVGSHLQIGECRIIISQLGKICHTRCAIYHQAGDCVMPREGVFGVVSEEGTITVGDGIQLLDERSTSAAVIGTRETFEKYAQPISRHIEACFKPAFTRFDPITAKEGGAAAEILDDLTGTQCISTVIIFDPTGSLGLSLPQAVSNPDSSGVLTGNRSIVYYCRSLADLTRIQVPEEKLYTGRNSSPSPDQKTL